MTLRRAVLIAVVAIPAAVFAAANFIKAERFAGHIRAGVEQALNRRARFAGVSFTVMEAAP